MYFSFPLPLYSYPPSYTTIPTIVHMIWYWYRIRDMIDSLYYGLLMVVSYEICCLCKRPNTLFRFEYFNRMCDTVRVVLFWSGVTCGRILVSHVLYIACVGITLLFIMPRFNIMCLIRAFFYFQYKPSSIARVYRDIYQIRFSNGSWHLHLGLHTVIHIGFFWNEWYFFEMAKWG